MQRKYAIALVAALLVIAAGSLLWALRPKPAVEAAALPTFDYSVAGSWAARPKVQPPAVWEAGWDMDVILLGSGDALGAGDGAALVRHRAAALKQLAGQAHAFSGIGPVYAPLLRSANLDADSAASVSAYLSTDNRGRAFIIASDRPLPASLAPLFAADPMLNDRFGGVLLYDAEGPDTGVATGLWAGGACSRRYNTDESCIARINLRRRGGAFEIAGDTAGVERLTNGLLSWLNDNASKLAEPLGELEEIEIIEIKKPAEGE